MALDESALPELLDALRAGDGVNLIRDAVRLVMQELIELEAAEAIGAHRYERTDTRTNERNGHRPRLLATQAGDIELKIPKLSHGSVLPDAVVTAAADRSGVARGDHAGLRRRGLDPLRRRPRPGVGDRLGDLQSPRSPGSAPAWTSRSTRSATGRWPTSSSPTSTSTPPTSRPATPTCTRSSPAPSSSPPASPPSATARSSGWRSATREEETFWTEFLRSLRRRGLAGVRLVISDAHEGLKAAARKTLQGASWQRCRVHFARNVLARVPKGHQDVVAAALRTVFVHPTPVGDLGGVGPHQRTCSPASSRR